MLPPLVPSFTLTRPDDGPRWIEGRAGMRYRDLIPDRQGGRFVASHIQIREAGPVADYVHFHRVQFQMIYCWRGSVRVVYEDQGAPFVLRAGDCVLQPPQIRHRVLESSADLEVIEVGAPALHETRVEHALPLPTEQARPERRFDGQRFVRHQASAATWRPWRLSPFEARDSGIAAATDGLASVAVVRPRAASSPAQPQPQETHAADLRFWFVLDGELSVDCQGRARERLHAGDALVVPAALPHALAGWSAELQLLEVTLPA